MESLKERLARYREIKLSVIGRKSGKTISIPVWFVLEGETLPPARAGIRHAVVQNVLKNPQIRIDARGAAGAFLAVPIKNGNTVKSVIEKFREKYGTGDVKKYYSKFDVAVVAQLT